MKPLFILLFLSLFSKASFSNDKPKRAKPLSISNKYYRLFFAYRSDIRNSLSFNHSYGISFQKEYSGHGGRDHFWDKRMNANLFLNFSDQKLNYVDLSLGTNFNKSLFLIFLKNNSGNISLFPYFGGAISYYTNENQHFNFRPEVGVNITLETGKVKFLKLLDVNLKYGREILMSSQPDILSISVAFYPLQLSKTGGRWNHKNYDEN